MNTTTASHTMIARIEGHKTERRGFVVLAIGALVLMLSVAARLAVTHVFLDGTEQVQ